MNAAIAALVILVSAALSQTGQAAAARIDKLGWISGCWVRSTQRATVEEQWMKPRGGMMLGVGRTTRHVAAGDSVAEYEFTQIHIVNGKLVFSAHPSGQATADFVESELTDSSVVFSNPQHDFPQNVRYMRGKADSLYASVDGSIGGSERKADFRYARAECRAGR
ncbi:MAG TPA: DUF6265 family protein [Gemmatimonadaceae bacterium]